MGGEGSGRKPDVIKMAETQRQDFIKFTGGTSQIEIPNYSGVKTEALKTSGTDIIYTDADAVAAVAVADVYLKNTGDTATGNYTFDTNTLFIDATNDRVGIGTTGPWTTLQIKPATNIKQFAIEQDNAVAGTSFWVDSSTGDLRIGRYSSAGSFYNDYMTLQNGGNVGIGTSPDQKLTIAGAGSMANTTAPTLTLTSCSGSFFVSGGSFFYKGDQGTVTLIASR